MSKKVQVAIVGLGRVGSTFLEKLVEFEGHGVTIVGAAENDGDAPGVALAEGRGLKVYGTAEKIVEMGDDIDVIFDLTGNPVARKSLREAMVRTGNTHTVIAPEIMAYLIWGLIARGEELPETHTSAGY